MSKSYLIRKFARDDKDSPDFFEVTHGEGYEDSGQSFSVKISFSSDEVTFSIGNVNNKTSEKFIATRQMALDFSRFIERTIKDSFECFTEHDEELMTKDWEKT